MVKSLAKVVSREVANCCSFSEWGIEAGALRAAMGGTLGLSGKYRSLRTEGVCTLRRM